MATKHIVICKGGNEMSQKENDNNYQSLNQQGNNEQPKKKTGIKIIFVILGVILVLAMAVLAISWKRISSYLETKRNGVLNETIQYDLTVPDNSWIDDRYANGFGNKYEVKGEVIGVSTDGNTIVTLTNYSDGEKIRLYDLYTGNFIKEFESSYSDPFSYKRFAYVTTHIPLITYTKTNAELRYLDLETLEIYTLIKFKLGTSFEVIAFDSIYDFIIGMSFVGEDGKSYYSYLAYIDFKLAWSKNFTSAYYDSQANSDYLFLSSNSSTENSDKKILTIIDRKTGETVLVNKEIDKDLTILQDGFITAAPVDYSGGISFQDLEKIDKKVNEVYDVKGNLLGEIIGYPHIPWYPKQNLGAYITTANVLNEDVKKASGIVYLINADGKVVAYSVFVNDITFPITGASIDKYTYSEIQGCNRDGSVIIAQKMGDTAAEYTTVILDNEFNVIDEYQTGMNISFSTESGILWGNVSYGTSWVLPPKEN